VSDSFNDYASKVVRALRKSFIRAEADLSSETLSKKIRNASALKVPNVVVVGERERSQGKVTLRRHGKKEQAEMDLDALVSLLSDEIRLRR